MYQVSNGYEKASNNKRNMIVIMLVPGRKNNEVSKTIVAMTTMLEGSGSLLVLLRGKGWEEHRTYN